MSSINVYVTNEMPKPFNVYVTNETPKKPESLVNMYSTYEKPNPGSMYATFYKEIPVYDAPVFNQETGMYDTQAPVYCLTAPSLQELHTVYLPARPYNPDLYTTQVVPLPAGYTVQDFLSRAQPAAQPVEQDWVVLSHPDDEWELV